MERKEFIKKVEELGFEVKKDRHEKTNKKILKIMYYDILVAIIDEETKNSFNTMFTLYIIEPLMELIVEYSMTFMSDREEEKKFYIKPKGDIKKRWSLVEVGIKANGKSIFTLKELEELGIDVNHYDLEEVKND